MVETTEVKGTTLKVVRDGEGNIERCVPLEDSEKLAHELELISDVSVNVGVDGIDVWIESDDRLAEMGVVFRRLHEHGYVPRSGNFARGHSGHRKSEEKPGFLYAMPKSSVKW